MHLLLSSSSDTSTTEIEIAYATGTFYSNLIVILCLFVSEPNNTIGGLCFIHSDFIFLITHLCWILWNVILVVLEFELRALHLLALCHFSHIPSSRNFVLKKSPTLKMYDGEKTASSTKTAGKTG
jgi:hypothetical protein